MDSINSLRVRPSVSPPAKGRPEPGLQHLLLRASQDGYLEGLSSTCSLKSGPDDIRWCVRHSTHPTGTCNSLFPASPNSACAQRQLNNLTLNQSLAEKWELRMAPRPCWEGQKGGNQLQCAQEKQPHLSRIYSSILTP